MIETSILRRLRHYFHRFNRRSPMLVKLLQLREKSSNKLRRKEGLKKRVVKQRTRLLMLRNSPKVIKNTKSIWFDYYKRRKLRSLRTLERKYLLVNNLLRFYRRKQRVYPHVKKKKRAKIARKLNKKNLFRAKKLKIFMKAYRNFQLNLIIDKKIKQIQLRGIKIIKSKHQLTAWYAYYQKKKNKLFYTPIRLIDIPLLPADRESTIKNSVLKRNFKYLANKAHFIRKKVKQRYFFKHKQLIRLLKRHVKKQQITFYKAKELFSPITHDVFKSLRMNKMIWSNSNGSIGFAGPKRQLPYASSKLGLIAGRFIKKKKYRKMPLFIILRTKLSIQTTNFFNGLKIVRPNIGFVLPKYTIAHNRKRFRKLRRV